MNPNTIIVGWKTENGDGAAMTVAGLDSSPQEQAELMDAAGRLHRYPKGVKRLVQYRVEPVQTAIFIARISASISRFKIITQRQVIKVILFEARFNRRVIGNAPSLRES